MKKLGILLLALFFFSCQQKTIDIQHLDGYWEIKKVESDQGKSKEFQINETVDYFVVKDSTGFRKKVKPMFSGTYQGSKDVEQFLIQTNNGLVVLVYKTPFDTWKEEIISLTQEELVIKNENNLTYTYQRYKSLLEFDEE